MKVSEAAKMWKVTPTRVNQWIRQGRVPATQVSMGARYRYEIRATAKRPEHQTPGRKKGSKIAKPVAKRLTKVHGGEKRAAKAKPVRAPQPVATARRARAV